MDLITNSYDKPYLEFSDGVFGALDALKQFNYERIYKNPLIRTESPKIVRMFKELYAVYCEHIRQQENLQDIYHYHLADVDSSYRENTSVERQAIDFLAGMTDDFFNNQYQKLFVPQTYGYAVARNRADENQ
jgi:dGTPase